MRYTRRSAFDAWEFFLTVVGVGAVGYWTVTAHEAPWWLYLGEIAAMSTALFTRRQVPWLAAAVGATAAVLPVFDSIDAVAPWTVAQLILFSLTLRARMSRSVWVACGLALLLLTSSISGYGVDQSPALPLGVMAWTFGVWGLATSIATQRTIVATLADRAEELLTSREGEIARRLAEQRLQIARDLHDELAHNVAVIAINAGAAEAAVRNHTAEAVPALRTIRATARSVLTELQQILGLLRSDDARDSILPTSDDVMSSARALGLEVTVDGPWLPPDEPATSHITAVRILQEALTNARRHGADGTAQVRFGCQAGEWTMVVSNLVRPTPVAGEGPPAGTGFGLIGMRERAGLAGASFEHQVNGGHFVVRLAVPLNPAHDPTYQEAR